MGNGRKCNVCQELLSVKSQLWGRLLAFMALVVDVSLRQVACEVMRRRTCVFAAYLPLWSGTKCQFNCKSGTFGWGEMKCIGKGLAKDLVADGDHTKLFKEWEFADAGSGCISASEDNLYGAPVDLEAKQDALAVVVSLKMPTANLRNDASWDKKKRSMAQKYAFKVEPSGELACPVTLQIHYIYYIKNLCLEMQDSPIKDSVICFGGKFGGEYNISAVIVSGKGTGE